MKSRGPILFTATLALLLAAPGIEATRTMPRALAPPAGRVSACDFSVAALDCSSAVGRSPQHLTLLSRRDRDLLPVLALLSDRNRSELLSSRRLVLGQSDIVWSKPSETPILSASTTGNDRHLHGRTYLPELGLYDYRARFYEPTSSTFLEPDPLGPVDSPNLYQAFGFDGLNIRDPSGMGGPVLSVGRLLDMARVQGVSDKGQRELVASHQMVGEFSLGLAEGAVDPLAQVAKTCGSNPLVCASPLTLAGYQGIRTGLAIHGRIRQSRSAGGTTGEGLTVALGDVTGVTPLVESATGWGVYGDRLTLRQSLRRAGRGTSQLGLTTTAVAGAVHSLATSKLPLASSHTEGPAPASAPPIPERIYRSGGKSPSNLTPRPIDNGMLSTRDSLSNPWPLPEGQKPVMPVGKPIQVIDTSRLPDNAIIPDGAPWGPQPPGHVSVGPDIPASVVKDAVVETISKKLTK